MRFELDGAAPVDDPTPEQVERGLRALEVPEPSFAILGVTESTYLQAAADGDGKFLLEFQDGSLEEHYRTVRPVPLEDLVGAFASYLRQDGGWRSGHEWERMDARPVPMAARGHRERRSLSRGRVFARLGIGLVWVLVQVVILVALFIAGGLVGALGSLIAPRYYGLPLAIGFVAGIVAGLVVNHEARMWLLRLRLWRLRGRGQRVTAAVVWVDDRYTPSGRGSGTTMYTVFVRWQDPVSGADHEHERQYRFWGSGSESFEAALDVPSVPVLYAPAHPSRFVIDIPFAPTMADFVLA